MFKPSAEYSPSRPFKIFISLLDKDEIGVPLTENLVFDAFRALKKSIESESDQGEEVNNPLYLLTSSLNMVFVDEDNSQYAV